MNDVSFGREIPVNAYIAGLDAADLRMRQNAAELLAANDLAGGFDESVRHGMVVETGNGDYAGWKTSRYAGSRDGFHVTSPKGHDVGYVRAIADGWSVRHDGFNHSPRNGHAGWIATSSRQEAIDYVVLAQRAHMEKYS